MSRYSKEERILIVKTHCRCGECFAGTVRQMRRNLGGKMPNESMVRRLVTNFETKGSIADGESPGRHRTARSLENISAVGESVAGNPRTSIRRRSQQ